MLLLALSLFFGLTARAEPYTLKAAIDTALAHNGELKAQKLEVSQAEQDIRRVHGEFAPKFEAVAGVGPITKAIGNATSSTEYKSSFGRMFMGKFTLTAPLLTWGREGSYENAATAGVRVKEAEFSGKEEDVRFEVKEAYYGFQLDNSLKDFIKRVKDELSKALEKRKKRRKQTEDDYRLAIFLSDVDAKEAEVEKYYQEALEGLALRLGQPRGSVEVADQWLTPDLRERKPVEDYVRLARASRSEFRQLSEGITAKRSLARAEKKALLPMVVFLASYEVADTNVRTPQPGVFAYDPYNKDVWSLGVGFKWDFQWTLQDAKSEKLGAEAEELEAKQDFATKGIETEVRKAYLEVVEAEGKLKAAQNAYNTGKKWLTSEVIGYSSGLGGSKGLVEAYGARAETTKTYFEAVYNLNMAWAGLSKAVGQEVDPSLAGS
jgi:outer membrane protein TolC